VDSGCADHDVTVVTTGARCPGDVPHNAPVFVRAGEEVRLGSPDSGLRTYLAVRGGITVPEVIGSRATDILAGLGPPVVCDGDVLPVGGDADAMPPVDVAPREDPPAGEVTVRVLPGPRQGWFTHEAWVDLTSRPYRAGADCNRVGIRLEGVPLERRRAGELPSEGMLRGAVQIPPSGTPVLFLADHPVSGGYPVIGYVVDDDVDRCAQVRPGQALRFRPVRP
jgi:biotin-dependent carboxylase-like uncharacterized protein